MKMKLTKEQKQEMLGKMRLLGKVLWKVGAIKIVNIETQEFKGILTTKVFYRNRMWHPAFIVTVVILTLISIFLLGIPETYKDMKSYLKNECEIIRFTTKL